MSRRRAKSLRSCTWLHYPLKILGPQTYKIRISVGFCSSSFWAVETWETGGYLEWLLAPKAERSSSNSKNAEINQPLREENACIPDNTNYSPYNHCHIRSPHTPRSSSKDRKVDVIFRSDITADTTRNSDQDISNETSNKSQSWIQTKRNSTGWDLHLGNIKAFGNPEPADMEPLPLSLRFRHTTIWKGSVSRQFNTFKAPYIDTSCQTPKCRLTGLYHNYSISQIGSHWRSFLALGGVQVYRGGISWYCS